jgi:ubiquinone/menaquinone biosynthesis C-methylase UbiE
MTEPQRMASFKAADIDPSTVDQQIMVLDMIATATAVQKLKDYALGALAPQHGERALDLGSGTGEDVRAFAALVGSDAAFGVEPNAGIREVAERRAAAAGVSVRFDAGDAYDLPYPDGFFDCVRCDRVFQHLEQPERATAEIVRVLRPGGRAAIIDTDWGTAIIHPGDPELLATATAAMFARSANPFSGRRLRGLLVGAGMDILDGTAEAWIQPQEAALRPPASIFGVEAAQAGTLTQAQADELHRGFSDGASVGAFHMSLTMYGVAAIKPSS